jgi:hypothetical protein
MAQDEALRAQLLEAREKIRAQLVQIEGAAGDAYAGVTPDGRGVYAELQEELRQIDELLGNQD